MVIKIQLNNPDIHELDMDTLSEMQDKIKECFKDKDVYIVFTEISDCTLYA